MSDETAILFMRERDELRAQCATLRRQRDELRAQIAVTLDSVDYLNGNCRSNELVGAVLTEGFLLQLRAVYDATAPTEGQDG